MEANTPATPSSPDGNPIQDKVADNVDGNVQGKVEGNDRSKVEGKVSAPTRPRGPNSSAIVVGLVAMVLAGLFIANETMSLRVDWSRLGPGAIVGIGVVMAVIGAIGLIRRHDDV
jgi:hypothetical protein